MAEQLWKGRFSKAVDSRVNDFNSSIRFDQRMIAQDMRGSGVHAAMLARQGIISEQDCADILSGLASIADDLSSGALTIDPAAEDVHTFVEQTLTARIGDAGKRLHTGRSRNDQVALDIRLTLRDYSKTFQAYIVELVRVLCKLLLCNGAVLAMYGLVLLLVPAGSISQALKTTALAVSLATLAMGNVAFLLYDRALHNLLQVHQLVWRPKLHKMLG